MQTRRRSSISNGTNKWINSFPRTYSKFNDLVEKYPLVFAENIYPFLQNPFEIGMILASMNKSLNFALFCSLILIKNCNLEVHSEILLKEIKSIHENHMLASRFFGEFSQKREQGISMFPIKTSLFINGISTPKNSDLSDGFFISRCSFSFSSKLFKGIEKDWAFVNFPEAIVKSLEDNSPGNVFRVKVDSNTDNFIGMRKEMPSCVQKKNTFWFFSPSYLLSVARSKMKVNQKWKQWSILEKNLQRREKKVGGQSKDLSFEDVEKLDLNLESQEKRSLKKKCAYYLDKYVQSGLEEKFLWCKWGNNQSHRFHRNNRKEIHNQRRECNKRL